MVERSKTTRHLHTNTSSVAGPCANILVPHPFSSPKKGGIPSPNAQKHTPETRFSESQSSEILNLMNLDLVKY